MSKLTVIAKKEIQSLFSSPLGILVLILTIAVFNMFFFMIVDQDGEATLRDIFKVMEFMFIFILPLLTMKTFAEEKSAGTFEFLVTTPTPTGTIVVGKFLGCLIFYSIILSISVFYYVILEIFADPDRLMVLSGLIGMFLEGAMFIAIGVMASTFTRNQVFAAMISYLIIFCFYFSVTLVKYFKGSAEVVLRYLGTSTHMEYMTAGLVNSGDLVYFLSIIILCLVIAKHSIDRR